MSLSLSLISGLSRLFPQDLHRGIVNRGLCLIHGNLLTVRIVGHILEGSLINRKVAVKVYTE